MKFDDYQKMSLATVLSSGNKTLDTCHWVLGLVGESGEIAEKFKKIIRDQNADMAKIDTEDIKKELGDVLWYIATLASELGISLDDIATTNIKKLASRKKLGTLSGSGDNRE